MCVHTLTQNNTLIPGHNWKTSVAPSATAPIDNTANFRVCGEKTHWTKSRIEFQSKLAQVLTV